MRCACCQVVILGGLAIGLGSAHQYFASDKQKAMIAEILKTRTTSPAPGLNASGQPQISPAGNVPGPRPDSGDHAGPQPDNGAQDNTDRAGKSDGAGPDSNSTPNDGPSGSSYSLETLPEMITVDQGRWLFEQSAMVTGDSASPEVYFLDARESKDYVQGHIWGAYHVEPQSFFKETLPDEMEFWPRDRTILVVYCQGGDCDASHLVSTRLKLDKEFKRVFIMEEGYPGWCEAQLPTETGG